MGKEEYKTTADEIWEYIRTFCAEHLDSELAEKSRELLKCVQKNRCLNIFKGDVKSWAAAVLYTTARFNFLFDEDQPYHIQPAVIGNYFFQNKESVAHKADKIEKECKIILGDRRYSVEKVLSELKFFKTPSGFVIHNSFSDKCMKNIARFDEKEAGWLNKKIEERLVLEEKQLREKLILRAEKKRVKDNRQLELF